MSLGCRSLLWVLALSACSGPGDDGVDPIDTVVDDSDPQIDHTDSDAVPSPRTQRAPVFVDIALESGMQAGGQATLQRGRACVAADFDGDSLPDIFVGNPGDTSYILLNKSRNGATAFSPFRALLEDEFAWAGSAADYDNDGDTDLYVSVGGNDGVGFDHLYRNMLVETGVFDMVDVTAEAGIQGPIGPDGVPIPVASANGAWGDVDLDGDLDLYVSVNQWFWDASDGRDDRQLGPNILWLNKGDGTFEDGTEAAGLAASVGRSRHSTLLDIDNDGDLDLYENGYFGRNSLWRNLVAETGRLGFFDITAAVATRGADVGAPFYSFATAAADMNQDGWEDIVVFVRGTGSAGDCGSLPVVEGHEDEGHYVFLNAGRGDAWVDVADVSGLNFRLNNRQVLSAMEGTGVMGSQLGDVNADGLPDVYVGNGGPAWGETDDLLVATGLVDIPFEGVGTLAVPQFADWTAAIDTPARVPEGSLPPPYPYRTHGTCMADFDGDGLLELEVTNGGPAVMPDSVREPDRLFDVQFADDARPDTLTLRLVGDGVTVPRDPVGTRVTLTVEREDGTVVDVRRALYSGSGFSGQNGTDLQIGLGFARAIKRLDVAWPDGTHTVLKGTALNERLVVTKSP